MSATVAVPSSRPTSLVLGLFCAAYFAGAELGHFLSFPGVGFATFWPPAGVLLAMLLLNTPRTWPWFVLVALPADLISSVMLHDQPPAASVVFWVGNCLEAAAGAGLVRLLLRRRPTFASPHELLIFLGAAALAAPLIGATLGALALKYAGEQQAFWQDWVLWWAADSLGIILVAPIPLTWADNDDRANHAVRRTVARRLEWVAAIILLVALTGRAFHQPSESALLAAKFPLFVIMPPLLWLSIRFEPRDVVVGTLAMALFVLWCTTRGFGSLARPEFIMTQQITLLQIMLTGTNCLMLLLASTIQRRERAETQLRAESLELARSEAEAREQRNVLQSILDSMGEAVIVADAQGRFTQFNPAARRMHQKGAEDIRPEWWSREYNLFLADGVTPCPPDQVPLVRALRGESFDGLHLVVRPTAAPSPIHVRLTGRPICEPDGQISGAVVVFGDISSLRQAHQEQGRLIVQLQEALKEIKTLRGLISICARCKKIFNDQGQWQSVESYVSEHTDAEFTHGVCPSCGEKVYGDLWPEIVKRLDNRSRVDLDE